MRVTLAILGWTFDWNLEPTATASEEDPLRDLGATGGKFLSFTSGHEIPDDAAIHRPCSPFEDDSEI